jgi:hypothetical protein
MPPVVAGTVRTGVAVAVGVSSGVGVAVGVVEVGVGLGVSVAASVGVADGGWTVSGTIAGVGDEQAESSSVHTTAATTAQDARRRVVMKGSNSA